VETIGAMPEPVKLYCLSAFFFIGLASCLDGQSLGSYVLKNYSILDTVSGDLNRDEYPDVILLLKSNMEADYPAVSRPLIILEGISSRQYKLAARNDNLVLCAECGGMLGDPYQAVTIEKGSFTVMHYGGSAWRWTQNITFTYQPATGKYMLHRDTGESFHSSNPNKVKKIKYQKENWDVVSFEDYRNNEESK
jgi:hypothetical protein